MFRNLLVTTNMSMRDVTLLQQIPWLLLIGDAVKPLKAGKTNVKR